MVCGGLRLTQSYPYPLNSNLGQISISVKNTYFKCEVPNKIIHIWVILHAEFSKCITFCKLCIEHVQIQDGGYFQLKMLRKTHNSPEANLDFLYLPCKNTP